MQPPTAQPELDFRSPAPKVSADDVATLCGVLRGNGWMTAAHICARINLPGRGGLPLSQRPWNERKVRAIAEAADGAVLAYPGSPGYRLYDGSVTEEDFAHANAAWKSQIRRMIARRAAYQRRHHGSRLVDRPQPQP